MLVLSIVPFDKASINWQLCGSLEFSKTDQWLDLEVNVMSFIVADRPLAMHVKIDTSWVSYIWECVLVFTFMHLADTFI